jgi:hypothetical protein
MTLTPRAAATGERRREERASLERHRRRLEEGGVPEQAEARPDGVTLAQKIQVGPCIPVGIQS